MMPTFKQKIDTLSNDRSIVLFRTWPFRVSKKCLLLQEGLVCSHKTDFVKLVNSQSNYNQVGKINAVPLITFHNVELTSNRPYYTNAILFDQLMKYLHDNGFKVLTFKRI